MTTPTERWFGSAGHFIGGPWCRFHLFTQVGPWVISTVGDYHGIMQMRKRGEQTEPEEIGHARLYETMVFLAGPPCAAPDCACGLPSIGDYIERDFRGYNSRKDAQEGHYAMIEKWRFRTVEDAA